ncbi:MAG: hypothetical protein LUQ28_14930 [Methylococcaceae bacterium]|nr:hypothetical protein [Methylococcaceae bacterium]
MMNAKITEPITKILSAQKAPLAMLMIFITLLFFKTPFYTSYNLIDLVNSNSTLLIVAMGFTVVLIAGGVDLSICGNDLNIIWSGNWRDKRLLNRLSKD